jgi:protein-S-isoprenylcysteine O-methyltransferase Ste14
MRAVGAGATAVASLALAGASAQRFHRSGTTVDPFEPSRASVLVTTGANAITRNPMYVGLAGLLVANAVRQGSWAALVPVAGFVLAIDRWQIPYEEAALLANFGPEYESYCARVPRWLGSRTATTVLG